MSRLEQQQHRHQQQEPELSYQHRKYKKVAYTGPSEIAKPSEFLCRNLHEEENQVLACQLKDKIRLLRSLSIDIGAEVRYQKHVLHQLDDEFDKVDSSVLSAINRVSSVLKSPQYYYFAFLFLFIVGCFLFVSIVLRLNR